MADESRPVRSSIVVQAEIRLTERPGDELLDTKELQTISLFGKLKSPIKAEQFPGSILLRQIDQGDVICRQGERGQSAFYILTHADLQALRSMQGREVELPPTAEGEQVATTYILGGQTTARPQGWIPRLLARSRKQTSKHFIPNDGPVDVDYDTRQAPLKEGDVFGVMSCMSFTPRSSTVVANRDLYLLEFNRNIFDKLRKDPGYKAHTDKIYVERVLSTHLQRIELLRDLTEEQMQLIREGISLDAVEPGEVICEEGERPPSGKLPDVYLVRSGVVQVLKHAKMSITAEDVTDWEALCTQLVSGRDEGSGRRKEDGPGKESAGVEARLGPSTADILSAAKTPGGSGHVVLKAKPVSKLKKKPAQPIGKVPQTDAQESATVTSPSIEPQAPTKVSQPPIKAKGGPAERPRPTSPDRRSSASKDVRTPQEETWGRLDETVDRAVVHILKHPEDCQEQQSLVIDALNALFQKADFLSSPPIAEAFNQPYLQREVRGFPGGVGGIKGKWSQFQRRIAGRALLSELFTSIRTPSESGPPTQILTYLSRGDCFGEMSLILEEERQATCVAYDHPTDDPKRKLGVVELLRIPGAVFRRLMNDSPKLSEKMHQMAFRRWAELELAASRKELPVVVDSPEFKEMGLYQGQQLLVIDLDRCTSCGDCVRACTDTHDDGRTRLFLDGPRFDRFLIPSACRQCLNPSCMIGCPVGSIQKGENGQIEIRDWCIGCGLCAEQCPYDSIQMHDIGILPEQSWDWEFAPQSQVTDERWQLGKGSDGWRPGMSPFQWTLDFRDALLAGNPLPEDMDLFAAPVCFRHKFDVNRQTLAARKRYRLLLTAPGLAVAVWLNGQRFEPQQDAPQQKRGLWEVSVSASDLTPKKNKLAVQLTSIGSGAVKRKHGDTVFSVRLDPLPEAGTQAVALTKGLADLDVKLVTSQAVVCDLCSHLPNQEPACVSQCPHDAAIRVNALTEFPSG